MNFDVFHIIIMAIPLIIGYYCIGWMQEYYKIWNHALRYHTRWSNARITMYLSLAGIAVLGILVSLPFIILSITL